MRDFGFSGYGFLPSDKRDKGKCLVSLKERLIGSYIVLAQRLDRVLGRSGVRGITG